MPSVYEVYDLAQHSVAATGFSSRTEARQTRNRLNFEYYGTEKAPTKVRYVIVRGSEHPLGRTMPSMPFEKAKPPEKAQKPEEEKKTKRKSKKSKDV